MGRQLVLAALFLTRIPIRLSGTVTDTESAAAMSWFPVVGALLGAATALLMDGASRLWPTELAAALGLLWLIAVTGNLHLDGLMDTADGLGGGYTPERRLEIMKDSRVGAHGVAAGCLALLLYWAALHALAAAGQLFLALPIACSAGRWALVYVARTQRPARPGGLGEFYARHLRSSHLIAATAAWLAAVAAVAIAATWHGFNPAVVGKAVASVIGAFLAAYSFSRYVERQIGGMTGDTLGATNEVVVLAILLLWAAGAA